MQLRRILTAFAIAATVQAVAGCAAWQSRDWDLSHLRDSRATDIDRRLSQRPESVDGAFGASTDESPDDALANDASADGA